MVHQLISDHLKDFMTAMELKNKTQIEMINNAIEHKLGELSRKMEDNRRQLAHLSSVTPPPPWFPEVDEAKNGEMSKEPQVVSLEASKKAREAQQLKDAQKDSVKTRQ